MTDTSDRLVNMAQIMNIGSPQAVALGLRTLEIEHGRVVMTAPYREDLIGNPATGVIAGGVVTTMLDHASGQAVDFHAPRGKKAEIVRWLMANHTAGGTMTYPGMNHIHVDIGYRFVSLAGRRVRARA